MRTPIAILASGTGLALLIAAASAQAQSRDVERQLRDQLRQTTLELRAAQDDNAQLKARLQTLPASAPAPAPPPPVVDNSGPLRRSLQAEQQRSAGLQQQLEALQKEQQLWRDGYQKAAAVAKERDLQAQKNEALHQDAEARAHSCEDKNAQLVGISEQLLQRYQDKGVWQSLRDDEPLTGLHRVELEKLAQEYHARIVDQKAAAPAAAAPVQ